MMFSIKKNSSQPFSAKATIKHLILFHFYFIEKRYGKLLFVYYVEHLEYIDLDLYILYT